MELRRQDPSSPGKALTAKALAALCSPSPAKPQVTTRQALKAETAVSPSPRHQTPINPAKIPLWEQVERLEKREKSQRSKKQAQAKENKKLKNELANLQRSLKKQEAKVERLEAQHTSLQKAHAEVVKELDETKTVLQEQRVRAEKLERDAKVESEANDILVSEVQFLAFESRKHRTALAAGFKLLTALADQITFRNLLLQTERFLREKLAAENAGDTIMSVQSGLIPAQRALGTAVETDLSDNDEKITPVSLRKKKQTKSIFGPDSDDDDSHLFASTYKAKRFKSEA